MSEVWVIESDGEPIVAECSREDLPDVMTHRGEELVRYTPAREMERFLERLRTTADATERLALILIEQNADSVARAAATYADQLVAIGAALAGTLTEMPADHRSTPALRLALQLRLEVAELREDHASDIAERHEHMALVSAVRVAYRAWKKDPNPASLEALDSAFMELPCPYCRGTMFTHKMSCYVERRV